jgi:photosystem II stability/assembly factor-like uncharacterized protein
MKKISSNRLLLSIMAGAFILLTSNCKKDEAGLPVLTTLPLSNITFTTAMTGGSIASDGGSAILARGVCWSTNASPTITGFKTSDGTNTGSFISYLAGLELNTKYYIRAYATNSVGTGYGNELIFTTSKEEDTTIGYAVGDNGTIVKTINGGRTWAALSTGITDDLFSVYFTDANNGYAVGGAISPQFHEGIILKTTDGGVTWNSITSDTANPLRSVYFTDAAIGYAVGGEIILKTNDAGTTWADITSGNVGGNSVFFTDANTGYIVGSDYHHDQSYSYISKTIDSGASWISQEIVQGTKGARISVYFPNTNKGYVVVAGNILKTNDAATTWTTWMCEDPKSPEFYSVYITDAHVGYAVGGYHDNQDFSVILKTTDSGTNWVDVSIGTSKYLNSVFFTDAYKGVAVGDGGIILRTTDGGATWTTDWSGNAENLNSVFFIKPK